MRFLVSFITVLFVLVFLPVQTHAAADSKASLEEAIAPAAGESAPATGAAASGETHEGAADATAAYDVAADGHGAESGGLPQLNIGTYPSQIFWLLVSFGVLYLAFSKRVLPSIGGVVDARDSMIKGNLDSAQALKDQAEAIKTAYEKNLDAAKAQAAKAVQDVESAAKKKAADQADSFRRSADEKMKSAEARVNAASAKAMDDMSHVAAEVASVAAEKITGIGTDMQKAKAIVDSIAGKAKAA